MKDQIESFEQHRPVLFRLAYGMLGRVASAEDAVQEAFLRWQKQDQEQIRSQKAWLSKVVSRICLDELKSAGYRREEYIGTHLPEPVLTADSRSPEEDFELAESLSMALLVVLDELTPVERAVFLLREVFDYDYGSVADIVDKSESNCRKIAQRARDRIKGGRPRFEGKSNEQQRFVDTFIEAVKQGDLSEIESMLAEEAVLYSDGGGKKPAARKPVAGSDKIARFLVGIRKRVPEGVRLWIESGNINGEPGMIVWIDGHIDNTWSFHIEDGKIKSIYIVLNPDKLRHLKR